MNYQINIWARIAAVLLLAVFISIDTAHGQAAKSQDVISLKDGLKIMLQNEGAANLKKLTVKVDAEKAAELQKKYQVETLGNYTVYQGIDKEANVIGSVVIISEQGKEGPLQLLIALRPDGVVYDIGFTLFGEDKGKSALSWNYLKQFISKSAAASFELGKDIDGISGATWTSESVASAIKRATVLYAEFFL